MMECVDGEYQDFKSKDGAYVRKNFFGRDPERGDGRRWSDDDIWALNAAATIRSRSTPPTAAVEDKGQPTVILIKTVKGYGMGEAARPEHRPPAKKLGDEALKTFRDRFEIPIPTSRSPTCRSCARGRTARR
jgi:pyruvate dehydrogenase E1 component